MLFHFFCRCLLKNYNFERLRVAVEDDSMKCVPGNAEWGEKIRSRGRELLSFMGTRE